MDVGAVRGRRWPLRPHQVPDRRRACGGDRSRGLRPAGVADATALAVSKAQFATVRVVEEPVATALAYLNRSNLKHAFVYDLGGGTFDAAVVDCSRYPFRVVGHGGDPYLGGDDVDRTIALHVADRTLTRDGWDLTNDAVTFDRLVMACEMAKCELSESEQACHRDPERRSRQRRKAAASFRSRAMRCSSSRLDLVRRTFGICDEVLAQASLRARDIDAVFLAGGSTLLPGLRGLHCAVLRQAPPLRPRSDARRQPRRQPGRGAPSGLRAPRPLRLESARCCPLVASCRVETIGPEGHREDQPSVLVVERVLAAAIGVRVATAHTS